MKEERKQKWMYKHMKYVDDMYKKDRLKLRKVQDGKKLLKKDYRYKKAA